MQQGIQTLPAVPGQAAPAGAAQAPMPAMQPKRSQGNGVAVAADGQIAMLAEQYGVPQLRQMLLQGGTQFPSSILLGAITQRLKTDNARQGAMQQQARAQAAQQQGSVADEIMGGIRAAADDGVMRFALGSGPEGVQSDAEIQRILAKGPYERTPEDNAKLEAAGYTLTRRKSSYSPEAFADLEGIGKAMTLPFEAVASGARQMAGKAGEGLQWLVGAPGSSRWQDTSPTKAPVGARPPSPLPGPRYVPTTPDLSPLPRSGAAAPDKSVSGAASAAKPTGIASVLPPALPSGLTDEDKAAYDAQLKALQQAGVLTPEQRAAQEEELALMRSNIDARNKRADTMRELTERLYGATARDGVGAEGLLRIAGAMGVPRKGGAWLADAATATGAELGDIRKSKLDALKAQITAQTVADSEQNVIAELNQKVAERKRAIMDGNAEKANKLAVDIANLQKERAKLVHERQQQAFTNLLDERKTRSGETQAQAAMASANRPTELQQRIALFKNDPNTYRELYGDKESTQLATVLKGIADDPRLQELAKTAAYDPTAKAAYDQRFKELLLLVNPELGLGAKAGAGGASSTQSAADAILKKGP